MAQRALTTIFTPSPSCVSDLYFYQPTNFYISLGPPFTSDCLPSGWALSGYFSPGICPSGYTIACSSIDSVGSRTETVATCCPSSYSCQSLQAIYPWISTDPCGSAFASAGTYTMKSFYGNQVVETTVEMRATRDAANAYSVQVRWQASDLGVLQTAHPSGSLPANPSATTTSEASTPTSSSPPSTQDNQGGLSQSDTIAVVVAILGTLLAWLAIYVAIKTYRRTRESSEETKSLVSILRNVFVSEQQQHQHQQRQQQQQHGDLSQGNQMGRGYRPYE